MYRTKRICQSCFLSCAVSALNHIRATTTTWFHPHISRSEGTRLLERCDAGSFLLRESSKGGSFALSVVLPHGGGLGHYLVEKRGPDLFCLQGSENLFTSVEELLVHYCHNDSIGMPCRLRLPQRRIPQAVSIVPEPRPALPPRNSVRGSPNSMRVNQSMSSIPSISKSLPVSNMGALASPSSSHLSSLSHSPCLPSDLTTDSNETYEDMACSILPSVRAPRSQSSMTRATKSFDDLDDEDEYVEMQHGR